MMLKRIPLMTALLCTCLHATEFTAKDAQALVEQLGSEDFKVRNAASKQLRELALKQPEAEKLFQAHLNHPDPEVRVRLREGLVRISREARWWPASLEGRIISPQDERPRTVKLVNTWDKPVLIFWLDYEGKRKPWSHVALAPGRTETCHTSYEGHAWLFVDKKGEALGIFTLGADTEEIRFSEPIK